MNGLKKYIKKLKYYSCIIYYAYKNPKLPLLPKIFAAGLIAYAMSPIDLIPDFIPILGYLDDLIILSIGVFILFKMIPKEILERAKEKARINETCFQKTNWFIGILIILLWLFIIILILKSLKIF